MILMYLLAAVGLTPGGSSTVQYSTIQYSTVQYSTVQYCTVQYSTHLHTNSIQNNTINLEQCGPCPVFASFILAFALQLRKSTEKPQSE